MNEPVILLTGFFHFVSSEANQMFRNPMRYLYPLYATATFLVLFFLFFPAVLLFSIFGLWGKKMIWRIIRLWSIIWFALTGVRVYRSGLSQVRPSANYVVVANHSSYLDTAMIFRTMPFPVRTLAKRELVRIPLFGFLYRQMSVLVDRRSKESRKKSIRLLEQSLAERFNIFIFPEGAFNEGADLLAPFYSGAFHIALQTRTPILPVLFPDTRYRLPPGGFWRWRPGKCGVLFLPEIPVSAYGKDEVHRLKEDVFRSMETALAECRNAPGTQRVSSSAVNGNSM